VIAHAVSFDVGYPARGSPANAFFALDRPMDGDREMNSEDLIQMPAAAIERIA
jgi:hypothetical protein